MVKKEIKMGDINFDDNISKILYSWRQKVSMDKGVSPDIIFDDETLNTIAQTLPTTDDEFINIKGFGKRCFDEYGDTLKYIIREYVKRNKVRLDAQGRTFLGSSPTTQKQNSEADFDKEDDRLDDRDNYGILILEAVNDLEGKFGKTTIGGILTGSKAKVIIGNKLTEKYYYGKLAMLARKRVVKIIDELHSKGYLKTINIGTTYYRPALILSEKGKKALEKSEKIELKTVPIFKKQLDNYNHDLFKRLKMWRHDVAEREGIPPYCVFHDKTLKIISTILPSNKIELRNIRGIGKKTLERYGDAVLSIVGNYSMSKLPERIRYEKSLSQEKDISKELFKILKEWRDNKAKELNKNPMNIFENKILEKIAQNIPESKEALLKTYGVRDRDLDDYEEELLEIIKRFLDVRQVEICKLKDKRRGVDNLPPTVKETYELFNKGYRINHIARLRERSINTIYSHLSELIGNDIILLQDIIPTRRRKEIINAIKKTCPKTLTEIKDALPEGYEYGEIRCVLSFMIRNPAFRTYTKNFCAPDKKIKHEEGKLKLDIKEHVEKALKENPELKKSIAARKSWVERFSKENNLDASEKKMVSTYLLVRVTQMNRSTRSSIFER